MCSIVLYLVREQPGLDYGTVFKADLYVLLVCSKLYARNSFGAPTFDPSRLHIVARSGRQHKKTAS